ncbi:hypothetical protein VSR95_07065 [Klebsiella pneumoniae]|nr:hypothetical protein [Klebsiella pneumoniae]HBW7893701.1 hypothetical protein [Klebsiella pneumoniae]HDO7037928.1 hypothetical protein [Klebsiella pneumoniae]
MLISVLSFCEYLELLVLLMKITRHRLIVGHLRQIFLYINKKVGGSGGSVVQYPSRPRQLWVLLNHLLNFSGGSVALLGGSLPASEKSRFSLVVQNARLVVQWWFTFLLKKPYISILTTY